MLMLDSRKKSKEESWKEMSNLGCAGYQSTVIVVELDIIDVSVLIDNLYIYIIEYRGGRKASN